MVFFIDNEDGRFSDRARYLIIISRKWTKAKFVEAAQVQAGSYAGSLVERLYDSLVTYATDVGDEYRRYYSMEYSDLESFLYWKYNIPKHVIAKALGELTPESFLGYGSADSGGDYGIGQFAQSEAGLELTNRIFDSLGEVAGEDQN